MPMIRHSCRRTGTAKTQPSDGRANPRRNLRATWHVFCTVARVAPNHTARVLVLGALIALVAATVLPLWLWWQGQTFSAGLTIALTSIWGVGGVVIGLLAACVLYRLGQRHGDAPRLGQYTLLEKIGEGGMGAVYRASHALLRRPTAVKLLPASKAGAERIRRFEREVQITSQLTHPNTVAMIDSGRSPDGVVYYAMV